MVKMSCIRRASRILPAVFCPRFCSQASSQLHKTALYDFHVEHHGKMVPFAGWSMPLQYKDVNVVESAKHTRSKASLFDVSHMLQMEVSGRGAQDFLEYVMVADLVKLPAGSGVLSLITNSQGGIIDDCIVTRTGSTSFYIVANAANADKDIKHLKSQLMETKQAFGDVSIVTLDDRSLLALQGPSVANILSKSVSGDFSKLYFMNSATMDVCGVPSCRVSRCGYTGEDGVEISMESGKAVELAERLLCHEEVKLAGLAVRDVLRIEAGLCLYGNDMNEHTTPIEAGLTWCIGKRRRTNGGFLGSDTVLEQLKSPTKQVRAGLASRGPLPRPGTCVTDDTDNEIGVVTSGTHSPTLGHNVAMVSIARSQAKVGRKLHLRIRNKLVSAEVVKMPFVSPHYYRPQ